MTGLNCGWMSGKSTRLVLALVYFSFSHFLDSIVNIFPSKWQFMWRNCPSVITKIHKSPSKPNGVKYENEVNSKCFDLARNTRLRISSESLRCVHHRFQLDYSLCIYVIHVVFLTHFHHTLENRTISFNFYFQACVSCVCVRARIQLSYTWICVVFSSVSKHIERKKPVYT